MPILKLKQMVGLYAISRLGPAAAVPDWMFGQGVSSFSRGSDELTLVCLQELVPEDVVADRDWACFEVAGPFALGETGIVLSLLRPLSENDIGIFLVPTFSGDYLFIKAHDVARGKRHLLAAGHVLL